MGASKTRMVCQSCWARPLKYRKLGRIGEIMEEMRLEIQCPMCAVWCVGEKEFASDLDPWWIKHILEEHPKSNIALILDQIMLDSILDGG